MDGSSRRFDQLGGLGSIQQLTAAVEDDFVSIGAGATRRLAARIDRVPVDAFSGASIVSENFVPTTCSTGCLDHWFCPTFTLRRPSCSSNSMAVRLAKDQQRLSPFILGGIQDDGESAPSSTSYTSASTPGHGHLSSPKLTFIVAKWSPGAMWLNNLGASGSLRVLWTETSVTAV